MVKGEVQPGVALRKGFDMGKHKIEFSAIESFPGILTEQRFKRT